MKEKITKKQEDGLYFNRDSLIRIMPIVTRGKWLVCCDERDVRDVCGVIRCRKDYEECIRLMKDRSFECHVCLIMLRLAKKSFRIMEIRDHERTITLSREREVSKEQVH